MTEWPGWGVCSRRLAAIVLGLVISMGACAQPEIIVHDANGTALHLRAPAQRVIALAPHISESLFAIGGGGHLVATVDYSDYPAAALQVPRIGSFERLDLERILALKPDLIISWGSGNPAAMVARLKALGLPVFVSEPRTLESIADNMRAYGQLLGISSAAEQAAQAYLQRLERLRHGYASARKLPLFYEVWDQPLTSIGGSQIINDVINLCGGLNIFADIPLQAPQVSVESILAADPEVIIGSGSSIGGVNSMAGNAESQRPPWLDDWKKWRQLKAVRQGNLFHIHPDLLFRPTPRILDGSEQLCKYLDLARRKPVLPK